MVAVIQSSKSLHRIFNYNENKVKDGVASCILAENYPLDLTEISLNHKLNRLVYQAQLNENVKRNSLHISLNFAPDEVLKATVLKDIARDYMTQIGFGNQPYLVYQHFDAAHPHLHIITTNIQSNGQRIDTQNIGRNQSEKARKAIEIQYGLVKASAQKKWDLRSQAIDIQGVGDGKLPTKNAIAKVLQQVLRRYKYTSIPELNAVLKSYGVMADRGDPGSRVHQHLGLYYRRIDAQGNKVGVPIKASLFPQNPGIKFLNAQFKRNAIGRSKDQNLLKNKLDALLQQPTLQGEALYASLHQLGIECVWRMNLQGQIYGLTYVDHQHKSVFNGSKLGKAYSAKAMSLRCGEVQILRSNSLDRTPAKASEMEYLVAQKTAVSPAASPWFTVLFQPEQTYEPIPFPLKKTRKRKRKSKRNTPH